MKVVDLDTLKTMAAEARDGIWDAAKSMLRDPKIYLHWTAGYYNSKFNEYHVNIDGAGRYWVEYDFDTILSHTWKRNTGAVGLSLCCCAQATSRNLGNTPPTEEQIEAMARAIAVIANELHIPIDKRHVLTHGEAADNEDGERCHENYGARTTCERWDLEYLGTAESPEFNPWDESGKRGGDVLRGKAIWYQNEWAKGNV